MLTDLCAAQIALFADREAQPLAHTRVRLVSRDEVPAADFFFLYLGSNP